MPILEGNHLKVSRSGKQVLQIDKLSVLEGEVLALIGPNGAGKSTLMLTLAYLLKPDQGEVAFRGKPITKSEGLSYRRRIALVMQDPLLLGGSVFDNVASGLRFRKLPKAEIRLRVRTSLTKLGIAHLANRNTKQLSGGEAQRVSLARAFALQPEILLLDEPFSALDAPTYVRLLDDFQNLLAETEMTTILVTHDQDEAMRMGERVGVILNGRLCQIGPPEQVFCEPVDQEVAAFVGVDTIIPGKVIASKDGQTTIEANGLQLEAIGDIRIGREVFFTLRPEDITLWLADELPPSSARNCLQGKISRLIPQGPIERVTISCSTPNQEAVNFVALVTRNSAKDMGLKLGKTISLTFKASAAHLILH